MIASLTRSTLQLPLSALQQQPFPHASLTHAAANLASVLNATRPSVTVTNPPQSLPLQLFPVHAPGVPAVLGLNILWLLSKGFTEQRLCGWSFADPHV